MVDEVKNRLVNEGIIYFKIQFVIQLELHYGIWFHLSDCIADLL